MALKAVNISIANISSEIRVSAIITVYEEQGIHGKLTKRVCKLICCCAVDIYCTAALTSFSDSISYITYLFSEWHIFFNF